MILHILKTPERSCTSRAGIFKVIFPKWRYFLCHMMARRQADKTSWQHTIGQGFVWCLSNLKKVSRIAQKSHFLAWWPWPLIYDLDHQIWPRYGPSRNTRQISCLYVKRFSRENADRQTDRQTALILWPRSLTREVINSEIEIHTMKLTARKGWWISIWF